MAIRKVIIDGDQQLRRVSYEVKEFNKRLINIIRDMRDTMYANKGIGLSAIQVGLRLRIAVVDAQDEKGMYVFINPEITGIEGECGEIEGCLSVPNRNGYVTRPEKVMVSFQDAYGRNGNIELEGKVARILQHEIDHMNGVLYTDIMDYEVFDEKEKTT